MFTATPPPQSDMRSTSNPATAPELPHIKCLDGATLELEGMAEVIFVRLSREHAIPHYLPPPYSSHMPYNNSVVNTFYVPRIHR